MCIDADMCVWICVCMCVFLVYFFMVKTMSKRHLWKKQFI